MPRLRLQRVEVEVEIPCESPAGDLPSASIAPGARSASGMACAEVDDLVTVAVDDLVEAWYRNVEPVEKAEPSAQRVEEEFKEETGGGQIAACVTGVFRGDMGGMRLRLKMRIGVVGLWWWLWLSR